MIRGKIFHNSENSIVKQEETNKLNLALLILLLKKKPPPTVLWKFAHFPTGSENGDLHQS